MRELIDYLRAEGYENIRVLADGTIVGTARLMFTTALYMGLNRNGWEKRYCFEDVCVALKELAKLETGDDVPSGFVAFRVG